MPQREIELILTRQLASYLAMPIFIVDPDGTLIFYNEPAEQILGHRFDETGEMAAHEWATAYAGRRAARPLAARGRLPLMIALREHRPAHGRFGSAASTTCRAHRGHRLPARSARPAVILGAVAIFWEVDG